MTGNSKLSTVRHLLDTAESYEKDGNSAAAETYRNKAIDLMSRHGIEEMMLARRENLDSRPTLTQIAIHNPYALDKIVLLNEISIAFGVKLVKDNARRGKIAHLIGFHSDIERVEILYTSLLVQAFGALAYERTPPGSNTTSFRKSWLTAFSVQVGHRLKDAERRARGEYERQEGASTALVLADKSESVKRRTSELFPRLRSDQRRSQNDYKGYVRGAEAGDRADIGARRLRDDVCSQLSGHLPNSGHRWQECPSYHDGSD